MKFDMNIESYYEAQNVTISGVKHLDLREHYLTSDSLRKLNDCKNLEVINLAYSNQIKNFPSELLTSISNSLRKPI